MRPLIYNLHVCTTADSKMSCFKKETQTRIKSLKQHLDASNATSSGDINKSSKITFISLCCHVTLSPDSFLSIFVETCSTTSVDRGCLKLCDTLDYEPQQQSYMIN